MTLERGEIWKVDLGEGPRRYVVVSEERFNRGDYAIVAPITSKQFELRSTLPNCVALYPGIADLTCPCVIQGEGTTLVVKSEFLPMGRVVGELDGETRRLLVKAVGHVIGGECEPVS